MWTRLKTAAQSVAFALPAVLLVSADAAWAVDPREGGEEMPKAEESGALGEGTRLYSVPVEDAQAEDVTVGELMGFTDKEIRGVLRRQQAAWNRGDIDAFMEGYWKSDALRFASGGTVTTGWQATLDRYRQRYENREKMGKLSFTGLDVSVLGEDAALVFGRWKLVRADDAPGGLFTLLFRKIGGKWVIVHDHTSAE